MACGILIPWPGIKTASPVFLTTGPPWKSPLFLKVILLCSYYKISATSPVLHILSLPVAYFIRNSLYLLISYPCTPHPIPPPLLVTTRLVSVSVWLFLQEWGEQVKGLDLTSFLSLRRRNTELSCYCQSQLQGHSSQARLPRPFWSWVRKAVKGTQLLWREARFSSAPAREHFLPPMAGRNPRLDAQSPQSYQDYWRSAGSPLPSPDK